MQQVDLDITGTLGGTAEAMLTFSNQATRWLSAFIDLTLSPGV